MRVARGVEPSVLAAVRRAGLDSVEGAFAFAGGADLDKPGLGHRKRTALRLEDDNGRVHELYLKRYEREPFRVRWKRYLTCGLGRGPAAVEFGNVEAAQGEGLTTMQAVVCDEEGGFLGPARGYVIVTGVPGEALSRCAAEFLAIHGGDGAVETLTAKLAELVGRLHRAGHAHRDLYASHIFLHETSDGLNLYLIDLARMFRPRWRRRRWRVKDLAQLKYSMPPEWVAAHWSAFLAAYAGGDSGRALARLSRAVERKAESIRRRVTRRQARGEGPR